MPPGTDSEAILIQFSGPDAPGLTAGVTAILAGFDVGILDIGQAVVHETLALAMLIDVPPGTDFAPVKAALVEGARAMGLQAQFRTIPADALEHWMRGLSQDQVAEGFSHFIVTVLARSIT